MWFMHANASQKGGKAAVGAVETYLAKYSPSVVFADFNLSVEEAEQNHGKDVNIVRPIGPTKALPFTNWNNKGASLPTSATLESWGVDKNAKVTKTVNPGSILDYAMHGSHVTVTPYNNAKDGMMLGSFLAQFDHFPVIYKVEWPS
jgi:hypothetical protein